MPEESAWKTRESLLMRVKDQTDEQSWDDFVRYYRPFIYNLVRGMKIQHHDAEEQLLADIVIFDLFFLTLQKSAHLPPSPHSSRTLIQLSSKAPRR